MGSRGEVRGSSVETDRKIKTAAVQQDPATPSSTKGTHWPDFDGTSAVYSGPELPNLFVGSEDKEVRTNE